MIQQLSNNYYLLRVRICPWLLLSILFLLSLGLIVLYSASNQSNHMMVKQCTRIAISLTVMLVFAQIPVHQYKLWAPWLFVTGLFLLIFVLLVGKMGKGAQRWLDLGIIRFQPSELLKLAMPIMLSWYFSEKPLPARLKSIIVASLLLFIPGLLIARQPDLGTAIMVILSGAIVIFFAGISYRLISLIMALVICALPVLWHYMHEYQRHRVYTFLNPENDPLGKGYHIIQSKIAIGSGGLLGKGWLNGTQSHLQFLPEHATDFIFAVVGEEFGFIGCIILIIATLLIVFRGLVIAYSAKDLFSRLLATSLSVSFFFSAFVNIGMVTGILPVVGVPLPLVSYGGSSMVIIFASFGILMAIANDKSRFFKP